MIFHLEIKDWPATLDICQEGIIGIIKAKGLDEKDPLIIEIILQGGRGIVVKSTPAALEDIFSSPTPS